MAGMMPVSNAIHNLPDIICEARASDLGGLIKTKTERP